MSCALLVDDRNTNDVSLIYTPSIDVHFLYDDRIPNDEIELLS